MNKLLLLSLLALQGCGLIASTINTVSPESAWSNPEVVKPAYLQRPENKLPSPKTGPILISVYKFSDQTGQRKPNDRLAVFSSAVTQAPDAFLIKALQDVGDGKWFRVVERGGIDNLIKERQLIKSMRDLYEGPKAKPLDPLLFSGIIIEGGIIGYDSSVTSGGAGYRFLGVGPQTQYRTDLITVSLRAVSVNTGEVLLAVTVSKNIASYSDDFNILKFVDLNTKAFESEVGIAANESVNLATQRAIEAAVVEMIRQGEKKNYWSFMTTTAGD
jgi:curli production assembly/transport component CsgG